MKFLVDETLKDTEREEKEEHNVRHTTTFHWSSWRESQRKWKLAGTTGLLLEMKSGSNVQLPENDTTKHCSFVCILYFFHSLMTRKEKSYYKHKKNMEGYFITITSQTIEEYKEITLHTDLSHAISCGWNKTNDPAQESNDHTDRKKRRTGDTFRFTLPLS